MGREGHRGIYLKFIAHVRAISEKPASLSEGLLQLISSRLPTQLVCVSCESSPLGTGTTEAPTFFSKSGKPPRLYTYTAHTVNYCPGDRRL